MMRSESSPNEMYKDQPTSSAVHKDKTGYKRPMDLAILFISHLLFTPVLLILWAAISLSIWLEDRGPIFYRQDRRGKNGQIISLLKFRTMIPNADRQGPAWTIQGDSRITNTGRWLRKSGLDELPQLLSLWKGDISLVGPRPLPVEEQDFLEREIPGFEQRLSVQPGFTGLGQIYNHGDGATGKLKLDLEYIRLMNPLLDMKIIVLTGLYTLGGRWDNRSKKPTN